MKSIAMPVPVGTVFRGKREECYPLAAKVVRVDGTQVWIKQLKVCDVRIDEGVRRLKVHWDKDNDAYIRWSLGEEVRMPWENRFIIMFQAN